MGGYFITFEGGEGVGKSTQIQYLAEYLKNAGYEVVVTREPGGTLGAECIRRVLLSGCVEHFGPTMEALLFAAARSDHVDEVIRPALDLGKIVLCDRFIDSTRVYQGLDPNMAPSFIDTLEQAAVLGTYPNLTFVLDLPVYLGIDRADQRRREGDNADRFEREAFAIHEQRRQAFLALAKQEKERCVVIDATHSVATIARQIQSIVTTRMAMRP